MASAVTPDVVVAAGNDGSLVFPDFLPSYDAASTFVHLLGLLAVDGRRLSEIVDALPVAHVVHETVQTPWEQKGAVMRSLVEALRGRDLSLVDGVKVRDGESWALVQPDPEEPLTHVWAEAASTREAKALVQEYVRQLRQLLRP
jgi:mannose-1-phosphate guanylyltransferase / phosphomannomutase